MNNKLSTALPLIFALIFACGMFVEKVLSPKQIIKQNEQSKVSEVLNLISKVYVDDVNIDSLSDDILPMILEKLDPHSVYISNDEYRDLTDPIRGSFEGIGVQFNIQNDTIVIIQVIHGGPSEKLNILAGDRIVSVNDSTVAGVGMTNEKVIKLLKGPKGTKVNVGIKRSGINEILPFKITRDAIPIESVTAAYMIDEKTGYIAFDCFSQTTYDEFVSATKRFMSQGAKNLIIDLRENGGGLLFTAIDLANEFLQNGDTIVFTKDKFGNTEYFNAEGNGTFKNLKICVLINEYSASASEIFAGAMQDNGRGLVIGRRSFGKGVVNEDFTLRDSSVVRLSTKKFYTPSGRCIQKPYNGSLKDYDKELSDRFSHGELSSADSVNFPDSLKYVTRTGKIVYGGGGIMPDIFVPIDSIKYSDAFHQITNRGFVYDFAFDFADKNRQAFASKNYKQANEYLTGKISIATIERFIENKKQAKYHITSESEIEFLEKLARCYVIRDIFGEEPFYELYNTDDKTIQKALEVLSNL